MNMFVFLVIILFLFSSTFCQKAEASQDHPEQIDKCNPGQSLRLDNNSALAGRQCHRWPWLWSAVVHSVYVSVLVGVCMCVHLCVCTPGCRKHWRALRQAHNISAKNSQHMCHPSRCHFTVMAGNNRQTLPHLYRCNHLYSKIYNKYFCILPQPCDFRWINVLGLFPIHIMTIFWNSHLFIDVCIFIRPSFRPLHQQCWAL